jgi:acylphosphatase
VTSTGEARLHVRVEGRVQGVGYRRFVEREARARGLAGWTRNLSDGAVEVLALGTEAALAEFRHRLQDGPPYAAVARLIELPPIAGDGEVTSFRVLPDARPGDRPVA